MQKLYCYVDETGQDTFGTFFLVSAVVLGRERDHINDLLEKIEHRAGKGKVKWIKTREDARLAYIEAVLATSLLHGRICYAVYRDSKAYLEHTGRTTQLAIERYAEEPYKATIVIDGLEGKQIQEFGNRIRRLGVRYKKVIGARDETNAVIRLADAMCGFTRAALHHHMKFAEMLRTAQEQNIILKL